MPNFYLAAAAGVAAAAQIITIESEKAPEFGYGGIIDGPSHANGGVDMVDTQTGRKIANVEGGEPLMVLSKDTYANNRMLINELLYNSQYRNGAPVSVNTRLSTIPASGVLREGGVIDTGHSNTTSAPKNTIAVNDNSDLIAELKLVRAAIQDQQVIFNDRLYEQYKAKKVAIRDRANA
ncbi:hypothetical protein ACRQ5D_10945 [Mucilaginibacter sp. P25]|uniref:hypothetical protein n=1 Tax=Mucilaginibacter sp. P25 TaxID=3423945 RepID=UPI003D7B95ED